MSWVTDFITYVYNQVNPVFNSVVIAVIIMLIGLILGQLVGTVLKRFLKVFEINAFVEKLGLKFPVETFISQGLRIIIYVLFFIIALNQLGLTGYATTTVAIVFFIIIIISGFLYLKDLAQNGIAGWKIQRRKLFEVGDSIKWNNMEGKVISFSIRDTTIQTKKDTILIPNYSLLKHPLKVKKK